jgi:hypothetical protein
MFVNLNPAGGGRAAPRHGTGPSRDRYRPYARFMQPDPLGYDDGMNMYAYVKGDPVNFTDPSGLCKEDGTPGYPGENCNPIEVVGKKLSAPGSGSGGAGGIYARGGGSGPGGGGGGVSVVGREPASQKREPHQEPDSPSQEKICRAALALVGTSVVAGTAVEEATHVRDLLRGGVWGARLGAFAGPIGAAAGAIIVGGGAYALSKYGDDWLNEMCREQR